MDSYLKYHFHIILSLPIEIIWEIEDYLISQYKKENAKACANIIEEEFEIVYEPGDQYISFKILKEWVLAYYNCTLCGHMISTKTGKMQVRRTHVQCANELESQPGYSYFKVGDGLVTRVTNDDYCDNTIELFFC